MQRVVPSKPKERKLLATNGVLERRSALGTQRVHIRQGSIYRLSELRLHTGAAPAVIDYVS